MFFVLFVYRLDLILHLLYDLSIMTTEHNHHTMTHDASRLEAFSDGIFAVIITITVIEMKDPVSSSLASLWPILPVVFSYVLSFVFLIIYWNNHHHLLKHAHESTPGIMWANAHLLFWLSFTPFVTIWFGEYPGALWPTVLYGSVLFCAAIAYFILQAVIVAGHGRDSELARTIGRDLKGKISLVAYILALAAAFFMPWISYALFVLVTFMWIVPDRRFKQVVG